MNFSADWAQSWADTRLHYKGYDRLTATAGYSHQFGPVSFNVRGAFYTSINDAKRDPQMSESYAEWESKNMGGRLAINGRYKPDSGFLTSLDYKVSGQLSRQYDWNKNWIFNPDGVITNTRRNGLQEGWFKRVGYNSEYEIESVPLNIYGQLVANKYVRLGEHAFTSAKVGLEYTYDGNRGQGLTYDEANPPQAQSSQRLRPRANKDIPALQTLSAFVGDRSSFAMGTMKAQFEAGVRLSNLFLNSAKSGGNKGFFVAEPRANININVLNSDNNRILDELSVNGGVRIRVSQGNSAEVEEMVADGTVEAGIIGREPQLKGIEGELLCKDTLVLVTPVNAYYTKLRKSKAGTKRLLEEPLILREEGSGTQKAADLFLEEHSDKALNIIIRSNNQEAIKRMVAEGAGVSVMSYHAAKDMEKEGRLYCYPLSLGEERCFYIIYRSGRTLSAEAARLISGVHWLTDIIAGALYALWISSVYIAVMDGLGE